MFEFIVFNWDKKTTPVREPRSFRPYKNYFIIITIIIITGSHMPRSLRFGLHGVPIYINTMLYITYVIRAFVLINAIIRDIIIIHNIKCIRRAGLIP